MLLIAYHAGKSPFICDADNSPATPEACLQVLKRNLFLGDHKELIKGLWLAHTGIYPNEIGEHVAAAIFMEPSSVGRLVEMDGY